MDSILLNFRTVTASISGLVQFSILFLSCVLGARALFNFCRTWSNSSHSCFSHTNWVLLSVDGCKTFLLKHIQLNSCDNSRVTPLGNILLRAFYSLNFYWTIMLINSFLSCFNHGCTVFVAFCHQTIFLSSYLWRIVEITVTAFLSKCYHTYPFLRTSLTSRLLFYWMSASSSHLAPPSVH